MGDLNAHHKKWSKGNPNANGEHIYKMTTEEGMKILQLKNNPTLYSKTYKTLSSPDMVIVGRNINKIIKDHKIGDDIGSDHIPIIIKLGYKKRTTKPTTREHWSYKKCDKEQYRKEIKNKCNEKTTNRRKRENLTLEYEKIKEIIRKSAIKCCPKTKYTQCDKGNLFWNEECERAYKKKAEARRKLHRLNNTEIYNQYETQRRETREVIRKAFQEEYNKDLEKAFRKMRIAGKRPQGDNQVVKDENYNFWTD